MQANSAEVRRVSEAELSQIFPDESIRAAFLARPDIARLPEEEQQRRWAQHRAVIGGFFGWLAKMDCYVMKY